jgi:hypothetical protein
MQTREIASITFLSMYVANLTDESLLTCAGYDRSAAIRHQADRPNASDYIRTNVEKNYHCTTS